MKIKFQPFSFLFILSILCSLAFISESKAQSNGFEVIKNMELLDLIYEHLDMYYVDDPEPGRLSKVGIDAMLRELDPYTVYYHENNIEDYRLMTTGQYGGVGCIIRKIGDRCEFIEPYEGKPAYKAGVRAGDKILEIDGKSMIGLPSEEVSSALKGPKGSSIKLKLESNGKIKTIAIERDEIKLPDVPYSGMISGQVGYIKLNSFTQAASTDVKKAYTDLKSQNMSQLILDLRGNGGGLLIEAVRIVNMFVIKDQVVVTTKGRVAEENRTYKTMEDPMDLNIPLVVLIDENSASASEIVAGSLQDLDRAVIIGTTSFGKGLVQRTYDLKYGSKMKLTIAKYYTPSGRCVQRLEYYDKESGMRPEQIADSLVKTFQTQNGRTVIDGRGIEPDIAVEKNELSRLTGTIYANDLIYKFANQFFYNNESIAPAEEFTLADKDYTDFEKFVKDSDFTYSTASEERLQDWKKTALEEGYFKRIENDFNALLEKVTPSKERDLEIFKDEIKELLENEIVSRYYFQDGRAEYNFRTDQFVQMAIQVLNDKNRYKKVLN
jgi:carboxyl-terminal processing protease